MGSRELKRVPLDFDWPLSKIWKGFINPHYKPCPANGVTCFGGSTAAGRWMDAITRFIAMMGQEAAEAAYAGQFAGHGRVYPHPYLRDWDQAPHYDIPQEVSDKINQFQETRDRMRVLHDHLTTHPPDVLPLTDEMLALVEGLAEEKIQGIGGSTAYKIHKRLLKVAKMPKTWGVCQVCSGESMDLAHKEAYEAWQEEEPPIGPGWQLWEDVSEGSPISPVFRTAAELADWAAEHDPNYGRIGRSKCGTITRAQWLQMFEQDKTDMGTFTVANTATGYFGPMIGSGEA